MSYHPVYTWAGVAFFFLVLAVGGVMFVQALRMRYQQLTQGKRAEVRWNDVPKRVANVFKYVIGQWRLPRNGYLYSGILHMFIFGAFMVLSIDTMNFIIDGHLRAWDVAMGNPPPAHPFHLPLSDGYYQAIADTFRFLCIVGLTMAFINRTVIKPKRLPLTPDAMKTLFFILGLMVFEVLQTASYLSRSGAEAHGAWFSSIFAGMMSDASPGTQETIYNAAWWCHLINLIAFTNYVPWSKHSHVFAAPANIFFMSLEPKGALRKMTLDFEDEGDMPEHFGAKSVEDLSWKQLFDGLSCTECGRCTDNCPASLSGKPLRPMHIIVDIKHHAEDLHKARRKGEEIPEEKLQLAGGVIDEDVLWSCTTCGACMEVCPVGNEHVPDIVDMRRYLSMTLGEVGHGASKALKAMDRKGNPWGMSKNDREKWMDGVGEVNGEVVDIKKFKDEGDAEYLYWVGCAGAYDDRAQKVTQSMARLMTKAGVDFAILGKKETCTGDSARRLGDEYLFQQMAEKNIKTLGKAGVRKIVTHCPHCFNTLKNEYPQFGGNYEVIHHSELLSKLVDEKKLSPKQAEETQATEDIPEKAVGCASAVKSKPKKVVYHDSCYLGRYNGVYDPQRQIINALPGVSQVETERNRQRGLCCGAGGGHMWMELDIGERMNFKRTDELMETGADTIAVACNFCMTMIDDGVKAKGKEAEVQVVDIAELLDNQT